MKGKKVKFINIKRYSIKATDKYLNIFLFRKDSDEIISFNINTAKLIDLYLNDLIKKKS